jgi:D-sedoheptulose 7-phosphate isomerase
MEFTEFFLGESIKTIEGISRGEVDSVISLLVSLRTSKGRLFIAGSGGGAGHASHAAADFRRLAGIESYAIGDNVSELTALINDTSWKDSYRISLQQSNFSSNDCLMVFSVGGGDELLNVSSNLVEAIKYAKKLGSSITGVVSSPGGYLSQITDSLVRIPYPTTNLKTPLTEAFQALIWHLLVSHPSLAVRKAHWESIESEQFN